MTGTMKRLIQTARISQNGALEFDYMPPIALCEGSSRGEIRRGRIAAGYGTSLYEFHYEYPIEGVGVRKDRIIVIDGKDRIPLLEYCARYNIRIVCRRCGKDITFEVSMLCRSRFSDLSDKEFEELRLKEREQERTLKGNNPLNPPRRKL